MSEPEQEIARIVKAALEGVLSPLVGRLAAAEQQLGALALETRAIGALGGEVGSLRARLAAVEQREAPAGPPGPPGPPGQDGAAGAAGLRYKGIHHAGEAYTPGDVVTAQGSAWHCLRATRDARPGDGSPAWVLMVKCGRDGRDRVTG